MDFRSKGPDRQEFEERQAFLRSIYRDRLTPLLPKLKRKISEGRDLSCPFLLSLTTHAYPEAAIRLMVVGQQTKGWENEWMYEDVDTDRFIEHLLEAYGDFQLGKDYHPSRLLETSHDLYRRLNPSGPENGFLWDDLVKVDENWGHRPEPDVEELLAGEFDVLRKEIELAEPHVIVFFAGPDYWERFRSTFSDVRLVPVPVDGAGPHEWWRRMGGLLLASPASKPGPRWFYTYHPGGFYQMRHQADLEQALRKIVSLTGSHNVSST